MTIDSPPALPSTERTGRELGPCARMPHVLGAVNSLQGKTAGCSGEDTAGMCSPEASSFVRQVEV